MINSIRAGFFFANTANGADIMPVFRTEKVSDYAVIAKHHLKNRDLSYKAKGLRTCLQ